MSFLLMFPEVFLSIGLAFAAFFRLVLKPSRGASSKIVLTLFLFTACLCFFAAADKSSFAFHGLFLSSASISFIKVIFLILSAACLLLPAAKNHDLLIGVAGLCFCLIFASTNLLFSLFLISVILLCLFEGVIKSPSTPDEDAPTRQDIKLCAQFFILVLGLGSAGVFIIYAGLPIFLGFALILASLLVALGTFPFYLWQTKLPLAHSPALFAFIGAIFPFFLLCFLCKFTLFYFASFAPTAALLCSITGALSLLFTAAIMLKSSDTNHLLPTFASLNTSFALCFLGVGFSGATFSMLFFFMLVQCTFLLGLFATLSHTKILQNLSGIGIKSPLKTFSIILLLLGFLSAPPLAGFLGKYLLLTQFATATTPLNLVFFSIVSTALLLSFIFVFKALKAMYTAPSGVTTPAPIIPTEAFTFASPVLTTIASICTILFTIYAHKLTLLSEAIEGFLYLP